MTRIALVDDHVLLRGGLASVINSFQNFEIIFQADNGFQFIEFLQTKGIPDVLLLDISMPVMDGFETAKWVRQNAPDIKILVLTMMENDAAIIRMLKEGARGYLLKDSKPEVLHTALNEVATKGFYFNDLVSGRLIHLVSKNEDPMLLAAAFSEKENLFLKLCCTEKSYKEIADSMHITPRAVEALRSTLFERLKTASRVGLVLYAIRNGIVKI